VGQIEVDESYFVARRVRGKRGRGALGKTIVFGLLKRGDKVYTEIVPNCKSATLQRIIKGKTGIDSVIHSDGWRGYNGLKYSVKSRLSCHDPINKMERITMIKSDFSGLSYAGNSACLVCDSSDQGILGHRESHEDSGADIEEVLEGEGVGVLLKAFDQASLVVGMAQLLALVSDPSTAARCVSTAEKHFSLDVGAIRYRSIYERLGG